MDSSNASFGLGVLFTLGSLPIAGCASGDDDDQATSSPTIASASASNTNGDTAGDPTGADDGGGSGGVTSAATDASADDTSASGSLTEATTATTATTEGGETGDLPPACADLPIPPICAEFGNKYADCYMMPSYYDYASAYCACMFGYYIPSYDAGPECAAAYEDYFACINALDCATIMDDQVDCDPEGQATLTACGFGGTTTE